MSLCLQPLDCFYVKVNQQDPGLGYACAEDPITSIINLGDEPTYLSQTIQTKSTNNQSGLGGDVKILLRSCLIIVKAVISYKINEYGELDIDIFTVGITETRYNEYWTPGTKGCGEGFHNTTNSININNNFCETITLIQEGNPAGCSYSDITKSSNCSGAPTPASCPPYLCIIEAEPSNFKEEGENSCKRKKNIITNQNSIAASNYNCMVNHSYSAQADQLLTKSDRINNIALPMANIKINILSKNLPQDLSNTKCEGGEDGCWQNFFIDSITDKNSVAEVWKFKVVANAEKVKKFQNYKIEGKFIIYFPGANENATPCDSCEDFDGEVLQQSNFSISPSDKIFKDLYYTSNEIEFNNQKYIGQTKTFKYCTKLN